MIRMTPAEMQAEGARMDMRARANKRVADLENALADARRDHADLVKLVVRMGEDLDGYIAADYGTFAAANLVSRYPYTIIGQREYDAAMHEAEGAPEGHELVEDVQ